MPACRARVVKHMCRESEMREGLEIIMIPSSSSFLRKAAFFLLVSVRQLGGLKQNSPPFFVETRLSGLQ